MKRFFPILGWLRGYKKEYLSGDLAAGITGGVMLIPQGMAYAMLAGLPPQYGLYTAIFPQIVYAILGTSRQLAVGPVAIDSLIVAAGLSTLAIAETGNYIVLAISLSFFMGLFQLIFGILRLGFLTNFLSKPVISGFTSGAAIVIIISQLKSLLKIEVPSGLTSLKIINTIIQNIEKTHLLTVFICIAGIIFIIALRKLSNIKSAGLILIIAATYMTANLRLDESGLNILGDIPSGFPAFSIPSIPKQKLTELITMALSLALIGYLEAISIAKAIHEKHRKEYELKNNQELAALGTGNIIGSFFSCYPSTGGFSRSAVNAQTGAKTNLTAIISATIVGMTLLWFTPAFYYLPRAILASIIIYNVFSLFDWKYPVFLWKTHREDFIMLIISFLMTVLVGISEGIITGVVCSLLYIIYQSTQPHYAVLGKLPHSTDFRNTKRFSGVEIRKDILVLRYDSALYYANTNYFISAVRKEIGKKDKELRLLILNMDSVNFIDSTSFRALQNLIKDLNENNIRVYFTGIIGPVRDFLHRTEFIKDLGEDHFFLDTHTAIQYFDEQTGKEISIHFKNAIQTNVFGKERL